MSKGDEQYQAYIAQITLITNTKAIFSGFTFTAITLLLTLLPNPSSFSSQIALFILTLLFYMFVHQLIESQLVLTNCVRVAPPIPPEWERYRRLDNWLDEILWILFCLSVALMYFLWNLLFLGAASLTLFVVIYIFMWITKRKPAKKFWGPRFGTENWIRE